MHHREGSDTHRTGDRGNDGGTGHGDGGSADGPASPDAAGPPHPAPPGLPPRTVPGPPTPRPRSPRPLAEDAISAFQHAPIAIAVCEPTGEVTRANPALTRLLGHPEDDLVGRDLFRLLPADLVPAAVAACAGLRDGSVDVVVHDTRFHTADGRLLDVRVTTSAVRAATTAYPHAIMHLEDITDREDLRRRLQHAASHDSLTGLSTRAHFLEELHRALPRGERHHQPVSVLYLDLNDFKVVNDRHGHAAGDRLLRAFAQHLRDCVRPEDTAARLGGDEFAVLCENTTARQAALVVERLSAGDWTHDVHDATDPAPETAPGVAIGVATSPDGNGNHLHAEVLLHRADQAMYEAKARRRR